MTCVGLLLALGAAGAAGKSSCKAAGCKLPDGARFSEDFDAGSSLTVRVGGKGLAVTASSVPIKCTMDVPKLGDEADVDADLSSSQHPQVRHTYMLTKSETRSGGKGNGSSSRTTEVRLVFKSTKRVVVSLHQVTSNNGKPGCDGSGRWTVKRES